MRCKNRPAKGSVYCFFHDPTLKEKRKAATSAGGKLGRRATLPTGTPDFEATSAESVVELLSRTVNQTLRGEIDPKVANVVGYLTGVILRAREQGEIEERLAKVEEALKTQGR
jgi:hypothetical protein